MDTPEKSVLTEGAYALPQSRFGRLVASVLGDGKTQHELRVDATTLYVSVRGFRSRSHQIPLEQLTGIRVIRGRLGSILTIEAGELRLNFHLGRNAVAAEDFVSLVRERCNALANGDLVVQTIDRREEIITRLVRYRARAIWLLVPLFACAYGLRCLREESVFDLDYFGSCARFWVMRGEAYRLLTGTWLHADLWHLGGNLLVIVWLGRAVERVIGAPRLVIVITASGLTAALGSLWLAPGGSIGASGVGMGLAASFAVLAIAYKNEMPRPLAKPVWWWVIFAFLLMPTPDGPGGLAIDHAAHATGAIGGGLVTWLLVRGLPIARVRVLDLRWLAGVCVAAHALALGAFTYRVYGASTLGELSRIEALVKEHAVDSAIVNELTWFVAIDAKADAETIKSSLSLAEKVSHQVPGDVALADTVATLHHRSGSDRRAAELEIRALELGESFDGGTVQATQLARFMVGAADKLDTRGVQLVASDRAVQLVFSSDDAGETLRHSGMVLYAVAMRRGQIHGLVRLVIGEDGPRERTVRVRLEDIRGGVLGEIASPIGVDVTYAPMMLRMGCPRCRKATSEVTAWPVDPDALAWP
ncbi:MAG: rhomboid family intramembrane serine protease [Clostridia bacterium]|nr:rhomboid family intramembrane serine protease [Deltaproteobacteria bacterium]